MSGQRRSIAVAAALVAAGGLRGRRVGQGAAERARRSDRLQRAADRRSRGAAAAGLRRCPARWSSRLRRRPKPPTCSPTRRRPRAEQSSAQTAAADDAAALPGGGPAGARQGHRRDAPVRSAGQPARFATRTSSSWSRPARRRPPTRASTMRPATSRSTPSPFRRTASRRRRPVRCSAGGCSPTGPAFNPFEHPVYDAWLIACKTDAPGA